ncbi:MAG: putative ABC transporter permease [Lachnospiraceae bacterium]|nr:putative ABC transporter permease [Lachnospiraceae bacterium]
MSELTFFTYLNIILICSLIGFVIEDTWLVIRCGYFDNRNMNLPFLLGYGIAVVLFYKLLGVPGDFPDLKYFLCVFVMVSLGEIMLGTTVEKLCHIYYWDYSSLPFHVTRYTSLFTSLGFALIITLFMRYCFPVLSVFLLRHETVPVKIISVAGCIALLIDYFYSFHQMAKTHSLYCKWRVERFI